jgi:hypothetical protein
VYHLLEQLSIVTEVGRDGLDDENHLRSDFKCIFSEHNAGLNMHVKFSYN